MTRAQLAEAAADAGIRAWNARWRWANAFHFGGERERRNRLAWREAEAALASAIQAWRAAPPAEGDTS